MSVHEAVAAETAAINAAVAAAAHEAAAKAAAAANERRALDVRTSPNKPDLPGKKRRWHGTHGRRGLLRGAVFGVGARVRAPAATAPGLLPHLATGCGEAITTAFDPCTYEYMDFGAGCWMLLGSAMGSRCAC